MPNYGYHRARFEGDAVRRFYTAALPLLVRRQIRPARELPFEVFSYSGEAALPEQVASIRSLLAHAGRPRRFTVTSDGSYSDRSIAILQAIDLSVTVRLATDFLPPDLPPRFSNYLRDHPTGRQLAVIMSLPQNGPVLYIDSDVLFFAGASDLANQLTHNSYLADCQHSADDRLLRTDAERAQRVNTGVLFLTEKLDWSIALERFCEMEGAPNFFTNQTLTQLAMQRNGVQPFEARRFVLQLDDQFVYPDCHAGPDLVLRHYVNPVRHKFWNALRRHG